jgi:hypothetical protein
MSKWMSKKKAKSFSLYGKLAILRQEIYWVGGSPENRNNPAETRSGPAGLFLSYYYRSSDACPFIMGFI